MAYTPNAEDTAQPTGNQALSTAALEFRTLKTYIQATKTAQDVRDDAQDAATALLAAALITQDTRDDAQDVSISTAQSTAATAQSTASAAGVAAAAAQADATTALANAALSVVKVKSIVSLISGSGNFTVPTGATSCLVIGKGGDMQGRDSNDWLIGYNCATAATKANILTVTAGDSIAYSIGAIGAGDSNPADTTFGAITCYKAPRTVNLNGSSVGWTAAAGWLVLVFY